MKFLPRQICLAIAAAIAVLATPAAAQKARFVQGERGDTVFELSAQDEAMNAAVAEARSTLPQFVAVFNNPPEGAHMFRFKFPLGGYEHIWVSDIRIEDGRFHGNLANNPVQEGWRIGDAVSVPFSEVSDWAYADADGYTHGAYTIRVMLRFVQPAQRAQIEEYYGW